MALRKKPAQTGLLLRLLGFLAALPAANQAETVLQLPVGLVRAGQAVLRLEKLPANWGVSRSFESNTISALVKAPLRRWLVVPRLGRSSLQSRTGWLPGSNQHCRPLPAVLRLWFLLRRGWRFRAWILPVRVSNWGQLPGLSTSPAFPGMAAPDLAQQTVTRPEYCIHSGIRTSVSGAGTGSASGRSSLIS